MFEQIFVTASPHTCLLSIAKPMPTGGRTAASEFDRRESPWYACPQNIGDADQASPIRHARPTALGFWHVFRQRWFNLLPKFI